MTVFSCFFNVSSIYSNPFILTKYLCNMERGMIKS